MKTTWIKERPITGTKASLTLAILLVLGTLALATVALAGQRFSGGAERGSWRCEDFSNPNEAATATWLQTYAPDGPGPVVAVGGGGGDGRQTLCAYTPRGE